MSAATALAASIAATASAALAATPIGTGAGLQDSFDGTGNITWTNLATNATLTNGALRMTTTNRYPVIEATTPINLQNRSATVQLVSTPNTNAASTQAFMQLHQPDKPQNYLGWMWTANNTLTAEISIDGKVTPIGTVTYTPTTQWLRITDNAGTLTWQTSPNGATWTTQASTPDTTIPFALTTLTYKLGTGHWQPETTPGATTWDNVSITGNYVNTTVSPHGLDLGVFVPQDGSGGTVLDFESISGGDVKYVLQFYSLSDPVPISQLNAIHAAGQTPVIGLEPWQPGGGPNQPAWALRTITAGEHDGDLQRWAGALSSLPYEVVLRPMHEMNGSWYPWAAGVNGNTATQYVGAWQHMRWVFQSAGAGNVTWMWAPNTPYYGSAPIADLFPGSAYVDILGIDGYNWGDGGDQTWTEPAALFGEGIRQLQALDTGKPIMIAEMGSAEDGGGAARKAAWITSFFAYAQHVPGLTGFIWFDMSKERDWRINSTDASLSAFRSGVSSLTPRTASGVAV